MSLSPGTRLGPYEIVAPLGAGGMGEVYRASDPRLGREVAIKVLPAELARDTDRLRRFEQEARAASALNQANLLTVFELGEVDGQPYLVTELLEGRSMRDALAGESPISARQVADWGAQIARGLAAAHEKGIVHRDLKPENLFVCADGRVKILDFGLAKLTQGDGGALATAATIAGGETASGIVLGTVGYMAPEQVRGERVDARADLFALGTVLYELLAGRRAFRGESAIESLNAILKEEPAPLAEQRPELPPSLVRAIERCLDKSPSRRFQSAADLAWALESGALSGATSALSTRGVADATPPARRGRHAFAVAALLAVGGLAGWLLARALGSGAHGPTPDWRGELMVGGSRLAYGPRVSPDGSTVAFMLLVDGQSQVAVMRPGEARWTQLTSERGHGPVLSLAWSHDGRLIYLHRAVPSRIYSVPVLGGEERRVLDAGSPAALPDGSLLVERLTVNNAAQLVRFRPGDASLTPVGPEFHALTSIGPSSRLAVFADGREAVYIGQRRDDSDSRSPTLWAIDIATGAVRDLSPGLDLSGAEGGIVAPALGIDRTRDEVLLDVRHGDLHVLSAIPRAGGPPKALLQLTSPPWYVDAGPDGALYADQIDVAGSLLRFSVEGGAPSHVARFAGAPGDYSAAPLELPGRGVLFTTVQSGKATLLLASARGIAPFVEIGEETSGPAARLDAERVAFFVGPTGARQIALATLDGRIVRRLPAAGAGPPSAFAALGDGRRLLYGLQGRLLEFDTTSGATRELMQADSGTVDPSTGELLVRGVEGQGSVIRRLGSGGELREEQAANAEIFDEPFGAESVDRRGRLLATIGPPERWFVAIGLSTPADRRLRLIPIDFEGDLFTPSWGADGSVLAVGWQYSTSVWRFTREPDRR